jgi:hypothetical protein
MDLAGNVKKDYIRIDNVEATGFWEAGIRIEHHNASSGFNDVEITNSIVHDIGNQGIVTQGANFDASTNVRVRNCTIYNVRGNSSLNHNSGNGIVLGSVKGGLVEHCVAYHNGTSGWGGVGIWTWNADNVVIQFNESYDNHTTNNSDGGGFDIDGGVTNSVMQYNYSHDNEGSGYGLFQFRGARAWGSNTVRYNISQNDARGNNAGGISMWGGGSGGIANLEIYGNTVFMNNLGLESGATPQALQLTSKTSNVHIRNNIFMTRGGVELVDIARGQSGLSCRATTTGPTAPRTARNGQARPTRPSPRGRTPAGRTRWPAATSTRCSSTPAAGRSERRRVSAAERLAAGQRRREPDRAGISPGTRDFFGNALPTSTAQKFRHRRE